MDCKSWGIRRRVFVGWAHVGQQAATAKRISKARHRWSAADFDWLDLSYEAATVRLFLELPPAGEGC